MGGKGGSTTIQQPDPIDPYDSANAQFGMNLMSNLTNMYGNRISQNTPYGNLTYETENYTRIDPRTGAVEIVDEKGDSTNPATAEQFNAYHHYRNSPWYVDALNDTDREAFNHVLHYNDYDDYLNNYYANQPKYLPNQIQRVNLSDKQQELLNLQQNQDIQSAQINNTQMDRVGDALGSNFNPDLQDFRNITNADNFSDERNRVESAYYDRFDKRFQRQEEQLRSRLANQGMPEGSQAWQAEMDNLNYARNDAMNQAIQAGGVEQNRLFNMDMQASGFNNSMRGQQMQEALTRRQLPINEYGALRSGQQIQNPNFQGFYNIGVQGGDIQGAMANQYDQQMAAYNASIAQKNNQKAGTNDLLKTGAMAGAMAFSDRRMKKNIIKIGQLRGHNIYKYQLKHNNQDAIGVMADEVEAIRPDCVVTNQDGFKIVNYSKLFKGDIHAKNEAI